MKNEAIKNFTSWLKQIFPVPQKGSGIFCFRGKVPEIKWRYHYLQGCKRVYPDDEIVLTPDKFNRWQIIGYLNVKTKVMPEYKSFGKTIQVPCAWINQKDTNFSSKFSYIYDANLGYGETIIYGKTPNEIMIKIQKEFEKTYLCFRNLV